MSKKKKTKAAKDTQETKSEPEIPTKRGVLIVPLTGEEVGQPESTDIFASLTSIKVPAERFDQQEWHSVPVSHALGHPLKATRWPSINSRVINKFAQGLFLNNDINDEDFGSVQYRRIDGAVLVASDAEGRELSVKDVEMLLLYLTVVAKELTVAVRAQKEVRKAIDRQSEQQMMQAQLDGQEEREIDEIDEEAAHMAWLEKKYEMAGRLLSETAFQEWLTNRATKTVEFPHR